VEDPKNIEEGGLIMGKWKVFSLGLSAMAFFFSTAGVHFGAELKYPAKPIQVIIPFAPGDTDNLLRPFIEKMPEYLGQPMTFVYKPGAAGTLGAGLVGSGKPDGYTLGGLSQSALTIVPHVQKDVSFTLQSFAPIACLVESPILLVAKGDGPWKNLKEMVAEAKTKPGQINFTTAGTYNIGHIAFEAFAKKAGIKMNFIPSQGSAPSITAVLGGHVQLASAAIVPALPHIQAGTLRALAVYSGGRVAALPDTPTFEEMGYPVVIPVYYGFVAPRGTPKEVIEKLYLATQKVVENHGDFVEERLSKMGARRINIGPGEYANLLKSQYEYYGELIRGIKP
jgi:tripartite-type tricarboxylate transporter receptor subunit TctC